MVGKEGAGEGRHLYLELRSGCLRKRGSGHFRSGCDGQPPFHSAVSLSCSNHEFCSLFGLVGRHSFSIRFDISNIDLAKYGEWAVK